MPFRAAVIGCGMIGSELADDPRGQGVRSHAEAYSVCPHTSLVALCDVDPERLRRSGKRWGVSALYGDPLRLLSEARPEVVSICTPDATHYELISRVLLASTVRAILAEKPLAVNLAHAKELDRLAKARGVLLAVNYSRRYAESHQHLRELIRGGKLGALQAVSGYYSKGTIHNGTHWFDLVRFLIGEVSRVWGIDMQREGGVDPTIDAFMELEGGIGGCLQGCAAAAFEIFEMDLIGTSGRVRIVDSGARFERYVVSDSLRYTGYRALLQAEDIRHGPQDEILHAVEDLVHCLKSGERVRCSSEDGVAALEIALAVMDSASLGRPVSLRAS